MDILALGILAAALQALGYLAYGFKVLKRDITPNATSWLMFAYGTTFLVILEWDRDASVALLALPIVCATLSIGIALYCLRKTRRAWWPEHKLEKLSFLLDILLTIAYLFTWMLLLQGTISAAEKGLAEIFILICWNIGIFTAFLPLLRQVYYHPDTEHSTPWAVWTLAYLVLAFITVSEEGIISVLLLYPVTNIGLHGFIALHTAYWRYRHNKSIA